MHSAAAHAEVNATYAAPFATGDDAFMAGYRAYYAHHRLDQNPLHPNNPLHETWANGWYQANVESPQS